MASESLKQESSASPSVVIVGSGFSGLALAIRLKTSGFNDFVILERAHEVGGTWRDNVYPGCACDIESNVYSFSFAPNPQWSQTFSPQVEILSYLKSCVGKFGLETHLRFNTTVEALTWSEEASEWQIGTSVGDLRARFVALGVGPLSDPSYPAGLERARFTGEQFHSSQWPASFNPRGKRIAVIGTGASAVQFLPTLQREAKDVIVFQRTPAWVIPRPNRKVTRVEKWLYQRVPLSQALVRRAVFSFRELFVFGFRRTWILKCLELFVRWNLAQTVHDRELRRKLTPDYRFGCKRVILSDDYWATLTKRNVRLVTGAASALTATAVVAQGQAFEVDAVIYGTGFRVTDSPFYERVRGVDGHSLADVWQGSPKAHLGLAATGFPNLFFLLGPNTGLGHNSVVAMVEAQADYILKFFTYARETHIKTIEAKPETQADYVKSLGEEIRHTVWSLGGCLSWYIDRTGRNSTLWPHSATAYAKRLKTFDPTDYNLTR